MSQLTTNTTTIESLIDAINALPESETIKLQEKTISPATSAQTVTPDSGYNGLSKVIIEGDADLVSDNITEGVTIFNVVGSNPYEKVTTDAAKEAIATAITDKGVTVPDGTMLDGMAALIESIEAGGGEEMRVVTGTMSVTYSSIQAGGTVIEVSGIGFTPKHAWIGFNDGQTISANTLAANENTFFSAEGGFYTSVIYGGKTSSGTASVKIGNSNVRVELTSDGFRVVAKDVKIERFARTYKYAVIG